MKGKKSNIAKVFSEVKEKHPEYSEKQRIAVSLSKLGLSKKKVSKKTAKKK